MEGQKRPRSIAVLAVALILGAVLADRCMPAIFAQIPTDLLRIRVLITTLRNAGATPQASAAAGLPVGSPAHGGAPAPDLVFFGDSLTMNGIDTRLLSQNLPGHPLAYNFGSPRQRVFGAYLYNQELPASVKTVAVMVSPTTIGVKGTLESDVYNVYYMYGFRPNQRTRDTLVSVLGAETAAVLDASDRQNRFTSRWAIRQWLDTAVRGFLRKDLALDRQRVDLFYPSPYTRPISPATFEKNLPLYSPTKPGDSFEADPSQVALLRQWGAEATGAGRKFVVVMAPMHPRLRQVWGPKFDTDLDAFIRSQPFGAQVSLINAGQWLDRDEQFVDVIHPSASGARVLTLALAKALQEQGAAPAPAGPPQGE